MAEDQSKQVMDHDDLLSLYAEVIRGVKAEDSFFPDTPLIRAKRATLEKEVAEILAKGHTPVMP
jgi:hypothetical protein